MKTLLLIGLLLNNLSAFTQVINTLDYNNASVTLSNEGAVFTDFASGNAGYEIPKGGGINVLYSGQFWFAGKTVTNDLNTCLGGLPSITSDVMRGPFSNNGSYSDSSYQDSYMFTICQEEIDNFKLWWECGAGMITTGCETVNVSNQTLNTIYSWPAHGDVTLGQSFSLAPFFDRDNDGVYNPDAGDYPIIKGCCATYMIQNDHGLVHTTSQTTPVGIEMHYMFYQYGANNPLFQTTFVDVMAVNRGNTDYPEFAYGFMLDADLGYYGDDYIGCDSSSNTLLFYNGDNMDEGYYLNNPPAIGIVGLEATISSCTPILSSITSASSAWNVLNGKKENGDNWYDPNGSITKFVYNGNPSNASEWTELSAGNISGDRRGLISTSHGVFNSGDTISQTYVITFDRTGNNVENAQGIINLSPILSDFYVNESQNGCSAGGIASLNEKRPIAIEVFPNPNEGVFNLVIPSGQNGEIIITSFMGSTILQKQVDSEADLKVDISSFAKGVYQLQLITEEGIFIKQIYKH